MRWARKAPSLDCMLTPALLGPCPPFIAKRTHQSGARNLSLDDTTGTQNLGIPFPNDPEPFFMSCTGLFSGSGPKADRTVRIPTPSPAGQLFGEMVEGRQSLYARLGCPHVPHATRPYSTGWS